jgi:hypothetical protein
MADMVGATAVKKPQANHWQATRGCVSRSGMSLCCACYIVRSVLCPLRCVAAKSVRKPKEPQL